MSDPRKDTMGEKGYYQMTVQEALDDLGTSPEGLSPEEVKKRLAEHGPNEITTDVSTPKWLLFLSQFKDLLVIVLIVAAAISLVIGSYRDATVMIIIVIESIRHPMMM